MRTLYHFSFSRPINKKPYELTQGTKAMGGKIKGLSHNWILKITLGL